MRTRVTQTAWVALAVCALAFIVAASVPAFAAATFPQKGKPITIIVPNAPGGTNDITARLIAPVLEKELGTPVVVVNKPGAATQTGLTEGALAKPDGYTLTMTALPGHAHRVPGSGPPGRSADSGDAAGRAAQSGRRGGRRQCAEPVSHREGSGGCRQGEAG